MTDDLSTLLRDAGREPTIDLDVDAVHGRGRRRAMLRWTALTASTLAVLGVIGVGLTNLLDAPEAPLVGPVPTAPATPGQADGALTPGTLAATLDVDVLGFEWDPRAFAGFELERTSPTGDVTAGVWDVQLASDPVVGADGTLWALEWDGDTVRRDGVTGATSVVVAGEAGTGWVPLATTEAGEALVTAVPVDPDMERPRPSTVRLLGVDGIFTDLVGVDVDARVGDDQSIGLAAWMPEHVAVTVVGETGSRVELLPAGQAPVTALELSANARVTAMAFVGDELWVVELDAVDDTSRLLQFGLDGELRATGPLDLGGPVAWPLSVGPDGEHVVVPVGPRAEVPVAHVLSVAAIRAGGTAADSARALAAPGLVSLLAPAAADGAPLAACATDQDAPFNTRPSGAGGQVWWLCTDATSQLGDGVAYPFVATELSSGGNGALPQDGPRAVIEAWAAGPPSAAEADGLSGGLDPDVASLADIAVDGATVVVDLTPGPQIGVLGTTYASGAFVHGIVGAALQYDELDNVRITLEGSCEAFGDLIEAAGCSEFDESFAPWGQPTP